MYITFFLFYILSTYEIYNYDNYYKTFIIIVFIYILVLDIHYDCIYIYKQYITFIIVNMMCKGSNKMFNYRIKFIFD